MKILVVGPQFPDSFARNIAVTLRHMGHDVISEDGASIRHHGNKYVNAFKRIARDTFPVIERSYFRRTVEKASRTDFDLILVTYGVMPPEVVRDLKNRCSSTIVCWFTDPISNLYRGYLLASEFDALFVKEPFLLSILSAKLGRRAFYLPECCNPLWHKRIALSKKDLELYGCDVAAVGTLHYYRALQLEILSGYKLKIWGRNCPNWMVSPIKVHYSGLYVAEEEKARAFLAAKVLLNTVNYTEVEGVNCSLFEAAGCGAFQIVDWKPALCELFEPEREIVTFRTREELKEKVDYYLAHPEERQETADRAYARAHREHTYQNRLRKMFQILGLSAEAMQPAPTPETTSTVRQ